MKPDSFIHFSQRSRAVVIGLLAIIMAGLAFFILNSREPTYQKKGLSAWIWQLNEGDADQRQAALGAMRMLDKSAVPILVARLGQRDGRPKQALISLIGHFSPSLSDRYISVEVERGYAANVLGALGPSAQAAVPALVAASRETNFCAARAMAALIQIRQDRTDSLTLPAAETRNLTNWIETAEILLCLRSNVQTSADAMVTAIGTNTTERFEIVEALGKNTRAPSASVLLLQGLLKDKEPGIRVNVLNMLIMQRAFAKAARQDILLCTNDSDANVRANATYALLLAFPEETTPSASVTKAGSTKPQQVKPK